MPAITDYARNRLVDALFRAQALVVPATWYIGLVTVAGSAAVAGTEVTGGSYARVSITSSLANFAGTQAPGSTVASTGSNGETSNNTLLTFPAPTANWGSVVGFELWDALTGGNRWLFGQTAKVINNGDPAPTFIPAALVVQIS